MTTTIKIGSRPTLSLSYMDGLNSAQEQAVTHGDGPVLVIAGAGTGKTKVIASRILYLLDQKKIPPSQILALTFTEKASFEMIDRVNQFLPLSYEPVTIKTFHSFCDQILREYGFEIGLNTNYKLLELPDLWLLFKKNLFKFQFEYYRPLGNPDQFISALINYFSRIKDEDITPDQFLDYAQGFSASGEEQLEWKDKFLELAILYRDYQSLLIEHNVLDFADLQHYCLRLFEGRKSVLSSIQDRFRYIMVDEFQDTNFAQNKLVFLLLTGRHKNLMVVGDDDQSIYKFRGASISNILSFEKYFPDSVKYVLTENYRSNQHILDVSYALIQNNNPYRLEYTQQIDKKLVSIHSFARDISFRPVQAVHFEHYLHELLFVSDEIKKIVESGVLLNDIAILVRTNAQVKPIVLELSRQGIESSSVEREGMINSAEIKDLIALLKFVSNPQDDLALFRLLQTDIFPFEMEDILYCVNHSRIHKNSLFESLRVLLKNQDELFLEKETLDLCIKLLNKLVKNSRSKNVSSILGQFLYLDTDYLKKLERQGLTYDQTIQRIAEFSQMVRDFELRHNDYGVVEFLDYIEMLDRSGMSKNFSTPRLSDDGVAVLTVHSSKGLEFDTVFLMNMVQHKFPCVRKADFFEIPKDLIQEQLPKEDTHLQEERRLFYVACTRAKRRLYFTSSSFYEGKKKWKRSQFVQEALASGRLAEPTIPSSTVSVMPSQGVSIPDQPRVGVLPREFSYTQIHTFETCPYKYKFKYIFRLPSPLVHPMSFGTSAHSTLNQLYQRVKSGLPVSKDILKELYEKNWIPYGYESKSHELARKKSGLASLSMFYDLNSSPWIIPAYLERGFKLKIGNFVFSGRIDRIDVLDDGTYEVIDYKTGKIKSEMNPKKDLQLSLYALACKKAFGISISRLSLYFIESNQKVSTTRSDQDLLKAEKEIGDLVSRMQTSDFAPTPGYVCSFCEFRLLCYAAQ